MSGPKTLSLNDSYSDRPIARSTADSHVPQVAKRMKMYHLQTTQGVKYIDTEISQDFYRDLATSGSQVALTLNPIAQGTSIYNRLGQNVVLRRIEWRLYIVPKSLVRTLAELSMVLIYYDKSPNGALALPIQLMASPTNTGTPALLEYFEKNPEYAERFTFLWRKNFALPQMYVDAAGQTSDTAAATSNYSVKDCYKSSIVQSGYKDLHGKMAQYKDNTGAFALTDLKTGALNILTYGNQTSAAASWTLKGTIRVTFTDLAGACC